MTASVATLVPGIRWLDWYGDGRVVVVDVGLACCALEFEAAAAGARQLTEPPPDARAVVVISGTVTDRLAPGVLAVADAAESLAGRRPAVVSFGVCASSGGPYWDSYAVTKGVDTVLPVDVYVAGCPPPPGALCTVIEQLAGVGTA